MICVDSLHKCRYTGDIMIGCSGSNYYAGYYYYGTGYRLAAGGV
jgi:hypothetical protein